MQNTYRIQYFETDIQKFLIKLYAIVYFILISNRWSYFHCFRGLQHAMRVTWELGSSGLSHCNTEKRSSNLLRGGSL